MYNIINMRNKKDMFIERKVKMNNFEEFLGEVMKTAKTASKTAGKKANEMFDITKIMLKLSERKGELGDLYSKLGKKVYEDIKNDAFSADDLSFEFEKISQKQEEIDRLTKRLKVLKKKKAKTCTECEKENPIENDYCSKCGAKLETEEEECCCDEADVPCEEQE